MQMPSRSHNNGICFKNPYIINDQMKGSLMKNFVLLILLCLMISLANATVPAGIFHHYSGVAPVPSGNTVTTVTCSNSVNGPFTSPAIILTNDSLFVRVDVTPFGSVSASYFFDANLDGIIDSTEFAVGNDTYTDNSTSSSGIVDFDPTPGIIVALLPVKDAPAMHVICRVTEGLTTAQGILVFVNPPKMYTLSGIVRLGSTPVVGAMVRAVDSSETAMGCATNVSGAYSLPLDAGTYRIQVGDFTGSRFSGKETTMVITGNTIQDFTLQELTSYIRGYVKDQLGNPIPNAYMWVEGGGGNIQTDPNGMYVLMVPAGSGNFGVSEENLVPAHMVPQSHTYSIADNDSIVDNSTSNFVCYTTNATITGTLTENGGTPVYTYKISASADGLNQQTFAITNGSGAFTLPVYSTGSSPTYGINVATWDEDYPIPTGMYADTSYSLILPGGMVAFNIVSAETMLVEPFSGSGISPSNLWDTYGYNNPWGPGSTVQCMNNRLEVRCASQGGLAGVGVVTREPYSLAEREYRILIDNSEMVNSDNTAAIVLADQYVNWQFLQNAPNSLQLTWEKSPLGLHRWRLARTMNNSYTDLWLADDSVGHYVLFQFTGSDMLTLSIDGIIKYTGPWGNHMNMAYLYLTQFNMYPSTPASVYYDEIVIGAIGTTGVRNAGGEIPNAFALDQNYPNPFNPSTSIRYHIATSSFVSLKVFNLLGQEVATVVNEQQNPGNYSPLLILNGVPSGVYYYRLSAVDAISGKQLMNEVRKAVLIK
jgi:hypothetical protein